VDDDNSPLLIVMTPCMSPVNVKIVYQNIPRDGDDLNDDEGDDEDDVYNNFDYNGVGRYFTVLYSHITPLLDHVSIGYEYRFALCDHQLGQVAMSSVNG
jgi:hypothetical protein